MIPFGRLRTSSVEKRDFIERTEFSSPLELT